MPLVEVARGRLTAPQTLSTVVAYLSALGKRPVVVADSPGFFMSRFILLYMAEAIRLVELGVAGPAEIDAPWNTWPKAAANATPSRPSPGRCSRPGTWATRASKQEARAAGTTSWA